MDYRNLDIGHALGAYDLDSLTEGEKLLDQQLAEAFRDIVLPDDDDIREEKERCAASLEFFLQRAWHAIEPATPFAPGWHLSCICEHLQAMTALQLRNLVINMPPRHAKSLAACVFWFCWDWSLTPASRWLFSSYSDSLSVRDSRKCQDVIKSPWYQRRWGHVFRLRAGERAMGKFTNDKTGHRIATSVGGRGVGEGGDYIIVDDPHKVGDTYSDVLRERVNRWWGETMSTRGNDPKTVRKVIIMQRLHERDLSGHVLAEDGYEHLCLPAEYEPKRYFFTRAEACPDGKSKARDAIILTQLQRERPHLRDAPEGSGRSKDGDLLWPERFGPEEIRKLKRELQAYGVSGQLAQRPAPEQGEIFRRDLFRYFTEETVTVGEGEVLLGRPGDKVPCFVLGRRDGDRPPVLVPRSHCRFFQTIDTALEVNAQSKYTAVVTFVLAPVVRNGEVVARYLLVYDVWREKIEVPEQWGALMQLRDAYPDLMAQYLEKKASGVGLIQTGVAKGRPFIALQPGTEDKVKRAALVATLYKSGLVYHRANMVNRADFEDELLSFPAGQYDDWVDCTSYGGYVYTHDEIINKGIEGALVSSPGDDDPPVVPDHVEVVRVGDTDVVFDDRDDLDPFRLY